MTSFILKLIALFAMTIDHASKIIGQRGLIELLSGDITDPSWLTMTYYPIMAMNIIGRIAFPIYAFLIVEGTKRTRSIPKYFIRLLLFGIISEPFYYFAFTSNASMSGLLANLFGLKLTNVFFTLALGVLMIYFFELVKEKSPKIRIPIELALLIIFMAVASIIASDYFYFGILLIAGFYFVSDRQKQLLVTIVWSFLIYALYSSNIPCFISASLSSLLLGFYNGQRGKKLKLCFYIYYPAHLALFTLIASKIGV